MKKKLSFVLALGMVLSLAACGNNNAPASTTTAASENTTTAATEKTEDTTTTAAASEEAAPAPVEAEAITAEPLVHLDFETTDGLTAVERNEDNSGFADTTAKGKIVESSHDILLAEGQGAVGNALYLDGKYGADFDMPEIDNDVYTIAFWYNADRVSEYGPVIQMGRNLVTADENNPCAWVSITKTKFNSADHFPVIWSRNSSIGTEVDERGVFPWCDVADDGEEHGKREWVHIAIVTDGTRYVADDGMERLTSKYYLNGELKWDCNGENMWYQGISPELFAGTGTEGHIGINYWDTSFKGFIDEFYIYNDTLTDGQVKTLFEQGNPPEKPVAPEYDAGDAEPEPEPVVLMPITPDASAIATLGNTDRELGWWTDHTDGYELKDGATLKFTLNNYSDGINNWDNFVLAFSNTAVKADTIPSADNYEGYAEYFVMRADAYGWCPEGGIYEPTYEMSWTDWADWLTKMTCANAEIVCTRNGDEATVDITFHFADSSVETEKAVIKTSMTADSPVYVHIGGEGAYIELLSVE